MHSSRTNGRMIIAMASAIAIAFGAAAVWDNCHAQTKHAQTKPAPAAKCYVFPDTSVGWISEMSWLVHRPVQVARAQGRFLIPNEPLAKSVPPQPLGPRIYAFRPDPSQLLGKRFFERVSANIEGLDLSGLEIDIDVLKSIVSRFKELRYLAVGDTEIDDRIFEIIAPLRQLQILDCRSTPVKGTGLVHLDKYPSLRILSLAASTLRSENCQYLPRGKFIEDMRLDATAINDAACTHLAKMPSLKTLLIDRTAIKNAGIEKLLPLKNQLERLDVGSLELSEKVFGTLSQFRKLKHLNMRSNLPGIITGKGLRQLRPLTSLATLDISRSRLSEQVPEALAATLPQLVGLNMVQSKGLTDASVRNFGVFKNMTGLYIYETGVGDNILRAASKMAKLEVLQVGATAIGDTEFVKFCESPKSKLIGLAVDNTGLTDAGMASLHKLQSLQSLNLNGTRVSDKSVPQIIKLKNLTGLGIVRCGITERGKKQIQHALPKCAITS